MDKQSRALFSGDVCTTDQGFLSCSVGESVSVRADTGLSISDSSNSRSVTLSCTATNTLTLSGTMSCVQLSTNTIRTRGSSNLNLQPLGGGVSIPSGKHLSLGGSPSSKYCLDVISAPGNQPESLQRWTVSDALTTDYMEILNGTPSVGSFVPTIQCVQSSSSSLSILKILSVTSSSRDVVGDACCVEFNARTLDSLPLLHKPLFQWRNGGGSRAATCTMELVPSNGKADLCLPHALDPKISLSGSTGNVGCSSVVCDACVAGEITLSHSNAVITSDSDLDILSVIKDDKKLLGLDSFGMSVSGRVHISDEDCSGDPDFDLLRVGGCAPHGSPPIPPTLLVTRSHGTEVSNSLTIRDEDCNGADSDFALFKVGGCQPLGSPPMPPAFTVLRSGAMSSHSCDIADADVGGDPDFDLLRVGAGFGLPSPGHTTLLVKRSGAVSHGQLDISGDPDFDLLKVHPRDASAIFSVSHSGSDFHLHECSNFVMENVQSPPASIVPGRLVWDSLRDVALVDTGTEIKKLGPTTIDQLDITLSDSSPVVGGSSAGTPPLTAMDRTLIIPPHTLTPGTKYSFCVDGIMSRFSATTLRVVMTVGSEVIYDDTCNAFSTTGGPLEDAGWSIEVDLTCRVGGQSGQLVAYGECMVPFERGDIPTQSNRVSKYDVKACVKRTIALDCTIAHECVVSLQWGDGSVPLDSASVVTYDLALAKKP